MKPVLLSVAALAASLGFAACATKTPTCVLPPTPQVVRAMPRMISPAPGATGLATSGVTVDVQFGFNGDSLHLTDQNGTVLQGGPFVQLAQAAIFPPLSQADHRATAPQLAAHTTYTAFLDGAAPNAGNCNGGPGPYSANLGTFTTQ